jgi:hypothetical protein
LGCLSIPGAGRALQLEKAAQAARKAEKAAEAARDAARTCLRSFSGDTAVLMADGSKKPISEISVGDEVIASDPETGEQAAEPVTHVWEHDDELADLVVDGKIITTTEDHPFWSVTDQRFEPADALSRGEKVLGADQRVLSTSGLRRGTTRTAGAYNLSVEGIHTYHVGDDEVLVHNVCGILPTPSVSNPRLQNLVNNLYKGTTYPGRVGNGTTMDAIRNELATGLPTAGKLHSIKGEETLRGLENWLRANPGGSASDRLVARSLADELKAVLHP